MPPPIKYHTEEERKEAQSIARKKYYLKNRQKIIQRNVEYTKKNKDKVNKRERERHKDGKCRVYLLPYSMYVGITNNVYKRMIKHRSVGNDITDYIILHICDTEKEARELEKIYHDLGFKGKNPTFK
jgi:hypothetical protein